MSTPIPKSHKRVVAIAKRAPLELHTVPTKAPEANEVLVRVSYAASSPLNLHVADGNLLGGLPNVGWNGAFAGSVAALGPETQTGLKIGDPVFGFTWRDNKEKSGQEYLTAPETMMGRIPDGADERAYATVPDSFVTAWHTLRTELGMKLPWPKPDGWKPRNVDTPVLVWGASSSVGWFALPLLKWAGYTNVVATAGMKHHERLKQLGATKAFDYRDGDVVEKLRDAAGPPGFRYFVDCIGSLEGSVRPIAQIAGPGSTIAIMLPVIVRTATETVEPIYSMDVKDPEIHVDWKDGSNPVGVRTHFYTKDEFAANNLQPVVMPALLQSGDIEPASYRIMEGKDMLERAEKALSLFRSGAVSGERLIWSTS
ncbi:NAD(P)-binding protein [Microthyrium microscopicum]|uniref:NAD(P)-binding protein n=1 Tax=Microthyrium microscopicum TaxID=703497 RepID=A0A6A6U039_9PEZI|nr:NAD(P)-binding protein [Microthyrium microscopicum]